MVANKRLLFLPGDGIGPEVMGQVRRLIEWMDRRRHVSFEVTEGLVGGAAYDAFTIETLTQAGVDCIAIHNAAELRRLSKALAIVNPLE